MYQPRGYTEREQLAEAIARVEPLLGADVVRLKYDVQEDWSGEPAIYFKVLLTDDAAKRNHRRSVTRQIEDVIETNLEPRRAWDLFPYYRFRAKSEQDELRDPRWA
jgi:hypothetical protein